MREKFYQLVSCQKEVIAFIFIYQYGYPLIGRILFINQFHDINYFVVLKYNTYR